jgi:hypothetical protein
MVQKGQPVQNCPYECSKSEVIDAMASDVREIKTALTGSDLHPNGLIEARRKDHIRIRRIEKLIYMGTGGAAVLTFIFKILPLMLDKS